MSIEVNAWCSWRIRIGGGMRDSPALFGNGKLDAARGSGQFLPCASPDSAKPFGQAAPELKAMSWFGLSPLFLDFGRLEHIEKSLRQKDLAESKTKPDASVR